MALLVSSTRAATLYVSFSGISCIAAVSKAAEGGESLFEHQAEYSQALQEIKRQTGSAPFIAFMLRMILDTSHLGLAGTRNWGKNLTPRGFAPMNEIQRMSTVAAAFQD